AADDAARAAPSAPAPEEPIPAAAQAGALLAWRREVLTARAGRLRQEESQARAVAEKAVSDAVDAARRGLQNDWCSVRDKAQAALAAAVQGPWEELAAAEAALAWLSLPAASREPEAAPPHPEAALGGGARGGRRAGRGRLNGRERG